VGAPVVAAYAAGQMFYFVATGDNTGAVTLNIDSLGAKAVTRDGSVALVAGDIKSGEVVVVVYDGTRFQVVSQLNSAGNATFANVSITSALNVGGVATFTANPVLSGGTANGVLYLNGSKVATSGSALTFDGTNLSGTGSIGTTIAGKTAQFNAAGGSIYASFADGTKTWRFGAGIISAGAISLYNATDAVTAFTVDATGNLGIGTSSPDAKLRIDAASPTRGIVEVVRGTGNTGSLICVAQDAVADWAIGQPAGVNAFAFFSGRSPGADGTERARIDSSGNLGLGVTPSAWASNYKALQINTTGAVWSSPQFTFFSDNTYQDSSDVSRYLTTAPAVLYALNRNSGVHAWYNAPSGTAGNAISFTQAMTLRADGRLVVGASNSDVLYACIQPQAANALLPTYSFDASKDVGMYCPATSVLGFVTGQVERARITSDGKLLVATSTAKETLTVQGSASFGSVGAGGTGIYLYINDALSDNSFMSRASAGNGTTTWYIGNQAITTSSDVRLKDNIVDTQRNATEIVNKLRVVDHTWNDPSDTSVNNRNSRGVWMGLIAQEAIEHIPWLVNKPIEDESPDGSKNYWHMDFGYAVPLLVKAIQEQQAMIKSLEAKVAALESK
jgi:hypothetical protein